MQLGDEVEPQRHPTCSVVMPFRYRLTYRGRTILTVATNDSHIYLYGPIGQ